MTNEIIKINNLELELKKEFLTDSEKVGEFLEKAQGLRKIVFDFSTQDGINQAKELKSEINKRIKGLEKFCEPLEEEGKKISKVRSLITTTLKTGKNAIIKDIFAPIEEREAKLEAIKSDFLIVSQNSYENDVKIKAIKALEKYDWLAFKDEAKRYLDRQSEFLQEQKIKFEKEEEEAFQASEKARLIREEEIRLASEKAAEAKAQLAIDEANKKVEVAEKKVVEVVTRFATKSSIVNADVNFKKIINNQVLDDLLTKCGDILSEEDAKALMKAIANNKIRHLTINY